MRCCWFSRRMAGWTFRLPHCHRTGGRRHTSMFRMTRTAATIAAVLVFVSGCRASSRGGQPAQSVEPRIELNLQGSTAPTIDVTGLPADDLARLEQRNASYDEWTALFRVVVASDSSDGRAAPS